jgi:hypothetical protein
LAKKLIKSLDINGFRKKIVTYVNLKNTSFDLWMFNFNTMIATLKSIVNSDVLGLEESYHETYFGCAF